MRRNFVVPTTPPSVSAFSLHREGEVDFRGVDGEAHGLAVALLHAHGVCPDHADGAGLGNEAAVDLDVRAIGLGRAVEKRSHAGVLDREDHAVGHGRLDTLDLGDEGVGRTGGLGSDCGAGRSGLR